VGLAHLRTVLDGLSVITDALLKAIMAIVGPIFDLLPTGHLSLPDPSALADVLGGLDSMVPILAPLEVALVILAAVVLFMAVRAVLVVVNIIWP
jgi:hypothetical protein